MRPHLRPHFDLLVPLDPSAVMARLAERFEQERGRRFSGHVTGLHGQLVVRRKERHVWSPWLSFEAKESGPETLVTGRFAPHPGFWTGYMAAFGSLAFTATGLGFFGLSQWLAGLPPTMLWSLPVCGVLALLLYLSGFLGQSLTREQMNDMRQFMEGCFQDLPTRWQEDVQQPTSTVA